MSVLRFAGIQDFAAALCGRISLKTQAWFGLYSDIARHILFSSRLTK